jgi:radical SAM superfamily enzyme YgiQ (UPF0313 family)
MNILLVYPKYPDTFWSFKHVLKFVSKKAAFPPLGLLTVAAMLPCQWGKRLVDMNVRDLTDKDVRWADMVFVSAMIVQQDSVREIIKRCNRMGTKVVAGGPLFTTQNEKFSGVDHFVLDEAEVTLQPFLDDLKKGKAKYVYSSKVRPDINKTPIPLWGLIDFRNYATMGIQYSRGCPFNCEFCDIVIMNGRVPRTKSPEQMVAEFQALYDAGWRSGVFVVDDNFIGNKSRVKNMLPHLIRWQKQHKYPFMLLTEASMNLAEDDELLQMMSAANFNKVFLGIETPNMDSLKECSKIQNTTLNLADAVWKIHTNGMQVMGGFIVGFDSDTENIFESQIKFIQKIGVVTAMVGMLSAFPQTRLWNRLKQEGRLLKETTGEHMDSSVNFIPKMGVDKLVEGYKKILSTIYSPKNYYLRIGKLLKSYKPTAKSRLSRHDVGAFFKSVWRIGILSGARFHYWKLMIKTLFTKKKAFPLAVELSIYGLHYEKVVKQIMRSLRS